MIQNQYMYGLSETSCIKSKHEVSINYQGTVKR